LEKENEMKARSGRILGAAVVAAAGALCAIPSVKAAAPILFEVSATSSTQVGASGGTINFDVLGLVSGTNASTTDDGLVGAQFSLIQTPAGITGGALTFTLSGNFDQSATSANNNTATFGSVPAASGGNIGVGAASTGSANDTIIGYTGISNTGVSNTIPQGSGTVSVSGAAYSIFKLGSGTLTIPAQTIAGGSTDSLAVVPRGGLGNLIQPEIAYIDGTLQAFRGDSANVASTPLTITSAVATLQGDVNGDGIVNQLDLNIINSHWQQSGVGFANGDINNDGLVNQLDLNLVNSNWQAHLAELDGGLAAGPLNAVSVPEPLGLSVLMMGAGIAALKRRRRA